MTMEANPTYIYSEELAGRTGGKNWREELAGKNGGKKNGGKKWREEKWREEIEGRKMAHLIHILLTEEI